MIYINLTGFAGDFSEIRHVGNLQGKEAYCIFYT